MNELQQLGGGEQWTIGCLEIVYRVTVIMLLALIAHRVGRIR